MIVEHPRNLFWQKIFAHGFLVLFLVGCYLALYRALPAFASQQENRD